MFIALYILVPVYLSFENLMHQAREPTLVCAKILRDINIALPDFALYKAFTLLADTDNGNNGEIIFVHSVN